jgi:hypothetical protein
VWLIISWEAGPEPEGPLPAGGIALVLGTASPMLRVMLASSWSNEGPSTGLSRRREPVEKVGISPGVNHEQRQKRPKIGNSGARSRLRNEHGGVFQQPEAFSEVDTLRG